MKPIRYEVADASGYHCDMRIIGRRYRHVASDREFVVGGYSWDAGRRRWMIGYKEADSPVVFMRLPEEFFGKTPDGNPRFVPVQ